MGSNSERRDDIEWKRWREDRAQEDGERAREGGRERVVEKENEEETAAMAAWTEHGPVPCGFR